MKIIVENENMIEKKKAESIFTILVAYFSSLLTLPNTEYPFFVILPHLANIIRIFNLLFRLQKQSFLSSALTTLISREREGNNNIASTILFGASFAYENPNS